MAGGIGSRFWPMSRTNYPKQFLDILNTGSTLIQSTFNRFAKFIPKENIYVVTSEQYKSIVQEQLTEIDAAKRRQDSLTLVRTINDSIAATLVQTEEIAKWRFTF
jgi:mannose-1-phosphate guanylyltransferase